MSRYFFHVQDGNFSIDTKGTELPDLYAARAEAMRLVSILLIYDNEAFWNGRDWRLHVTDAANHPLFTVRFMTVNAPGPPPLKLQ